MRRASKTLRRSVGATLLALAAAALGCRVSDQKARGRQEPLSGEDGGAGASLDEINGVELMFDVAQAPRHVRPPVASSRSATAERPSIEVETSHGASSSIERRAEPQGRAARGGRSYACAPSASPPIAVGRLDEGPADVAEEEAPRPRMSISRSVGVTEVGPVERHPAQEATLAGEGADGREQLAPQRESVKGAVRQQAVQAAPLKPDQRQGVRQDPLTRSDSCATSGIQ
jgi:hypothetical protein